MPEELAQKIADEAEMIVDGFAVNRHELGYRVVNLNSGNVVILSPEYKILESSMDAIEARLAIRNLTENIEFLAA